LTTSAERIALLSDNIDLLCIAVVGGFVLFGFHVASHFNRALQDKLPWLKYAAAFAFLLLALPGLAFVMASVYILNGDKMSAILAFQVGVSSPALLQGLIIKTATRLGASAQLPVSPNQ
jgi:hypothetical protein